MANKFLVWIDAGSDVMSQYAFDNLTDRKTGFAAGTKAVSANVNAGLRQANLVAAALMNAVNPNSNLDLQSSLNDVVNEIKAHISIDSNIVGVGRGSASLSSNKINVAADAINSFSAGVNNVLGPRTRSALIAGNDNRCNHANAAVFGTGNATAADNQFICGSGASVSSNDLFVVGNGNAGALNNAFVVRKDGNIAGKSWTIDADGNFSGRASSAHRATSAESANYAEFYTSSTKAGSISVALNDKVSKVKTIYPDENDNEYTITEYISDATAIIQLYYSHALFDTSAYYRTTAMVPIQSRSNVLAYSFVQIGKDGEYLYIRAITSSATDNITISVTSPRASNVRIERILIIQNY